MGEKLTEQLIKQLKCRKKMADDRAGWSQGSLYTYVVDLPRSCRRQNCKEQSILCLVVAIVVLFAHEKYCTCMHTYDSRAGHFTTTFLFRFSARIVLCTVRKNLQNCGQRVQRPKTIVDLFFTCPFPLAYGLKFKIVEKSTMAYDVDGGQCRDKITSRDGGGDADECTQSECAS